MSKMSITRALSRVKVVKNRLEKLGSSETFVKVVLETESNSERSKAFKSNSQSLWDEYKDLSKELIEIKKAIKKSNQMVEVDISGQKMTVEEAVIRKEEAELQKDVLVKILREVATGNNEIETSIQKIESVARNFASEMNKNSTNDTFQEDALKLGRASAEREYKKTMLIGFEPKVAEEKLKEINDFLNEVDYVLSESNATTLIEF